jgi:hypothetical protein
VAVSGSGRADRSRLEDGREALIEAGDLFDLPAGDDAWVLGDEPCVIDRSPAATRFVTGYPAPSGGGDGREPGQRGIGRETTRFSPQRAAGLEILADRPVDVPPGSREFAA